MATTAKRVKDARKPKFSSRKHNRCQLCGRPRGFLRKFGVCRCSLERVHAYIDMAVKQGAELLLDGRDLTVPGFEGGLLHRAQTVLDNVTPDMTHAQKEIFGPVASIIRVKDLDEAIKVTNASPFGNAASIYTTSGRSARTFWYEVQAGNVGVNLGIAAGHGLLPVRRPEGLLLRHACTARAATRCSSSPTRRSSSLAGRRRGRQGGRCGSTVSGDRGLWVRLSLRPGGRGGVRRHRRRGLCPGAPALLARLARRGGRRASGKGRQAHRRPPGSQRDGPSSRSTRSTGRPIWAASIETRRQPGRPSSPSSSRPSATPPASTTTSSPSATTCWQPAPGPSRKAAKQDRAAAEELQNMLDG